MNMELKLRDKVVVVAGGSSGIGRAAVQAFAKSGCRVAFCARDNEKLQQTYDGLVAQGVDAKQLFPYVCDVSNADGAEAFAAAVAEHFGQIDIWVNNAGVGCSCTMQEVTEEEFHRVVEVDMVGVWRGMNAAVKHMKGKGDRSIINISSDQALLPSIDRFPYAAAKAGVITMTKTAAADMGPEGIRVNAIAPGVVVTDMNRQYMSAF